MQSALYQQDFLRSTVLTWTRKPYTLVCSADWAAGSELGGAGYAPTLSSYAMLLRAPTLSPSSSTPYAISLRATMPSPSVAVLR
eukprot:1110878-Rhodomonas_salina.1